MYKINEHNSAAHNLKSEYFCPSLRNFRGQTKDRHNTFLPGILTTRCIHSRPQASTKHNNIYINIYMAQKETL